MANKSIWSGLDFSEEAENSAYDLLKTQVNKLEEMTDKVLTMEVESINSSLEEDHPKPVILYILYVVAPYIGNFRRKILTVMEGRKSTGRFPVDIFCHINDEKIENVAAENFLEKVAEIMSRPLVKASVENLFKQSKRNINGDK